MGRRFESETVSSGVYDFVVPQSTCGANGIIVQKNHGPHGTADSLGPRSGRKPFIQRAALVRFEVAERDVAERGRIDDFGHGLSNYREKLLHPGFKQQRFVVSNQKLVKLKVEI